MLKIKREKLNGLSCCNIVCGHKPANLDCRITSGNDYRVVQCGRSMIEMLGVLAIIGVLSVAGIAGYSKAMTKWKINKSIEQIEQITHNTFTAYANQKEMDSIGYDEDGIKLMKSLGIISEDMIDYDDYGPGIFLPFGRMDVSIGYEYIIGHNTIDFEYYNIPREACMALGSLNWENGSAAVIGIGLTSVSPIPSGPSDCLYNDPIVNITDGKRILFCNNADKSSEEYTSFPIPPDIVAKYCNCPNNECEFSIAFKEL